MTKALNILLVDDDIVDVMNLKRIFKQKKFIHTLYTAHNGEEALELLYTRAIPIPHVILLDLNMPRIDGVEFLHTIRNHDAYKHIHVVVLTTSEEEEDKKRTQPYNVSAYIIKPLASKTFADEVDLLNNSWQMANFTAK
jgi:CheY-like chemotaxis protein